MQMLPYPFFRTSADFPANVPVCKWTCMLVDRCITWTCSHSLETLKQASTSFVHDKNLHWRPLQCHQRYGDLSYALESAFHCLEWEFVRHCSFIPHYDLAPEAFLRFTSPVVCNNVVRRFGIDAVAVHGRSYTFSVKPKWWTVVLCFFATCSSAEAYLHTSPRRGHSTVGVSKRCEGLVAIWLRAREEFADNYFQLLFIYKYKHIYTYKHEAIQKLISENNIGVPWVA